MRISSEFTTKLSAVGGGLEDGCEEAPIGAVVSRNVVLVEMSLLTSTESKGAFVPVEGYGLIRCPG